MSKPRHATLALSVIARDSEATLGRCLESVSKVVDEMIVVDTGSIDRTVEIASIHGATVGHFEWCDDFAAARNAALDLVRSDYVLSLDSDEWIEQPARDFLVAMMKVYADPKRRACVRALFKGANSGDRTELEPGMIRLYPRQGARWHYAIHEVVKYPGQPEYRVRTYPEFVICHSGYDSHAIAMERKEERNRHILERAFARATDPTEIAHYRFYQGMQGDVSALEACRYDADSHDAALAYMHLLDIYGQEGRWQQMLDLGEEAEQRQLLSPYALTSLAQAHLGLGQHSLAVKAAKTAYETSLSDPTRLGDLTRNRARAILTRFGL